MITSFNGSFATWDLTLIRKAPSGEVPYCCRSGLDCLRMTMTGLSYLTDRRLTLSLGCRVTAMNVELYKLS